MFRYLALPFTILFLALGIQDSNAACSKPREQTKIADFGKRYMPVSAYAISVYQRDWLGLGISAVLINGLYALNNPIESKIHKKRPCGCQGSFPSGHMITYAASASYLHYRYGWQYGAPAYIAAFAFAADRVRNRAHGWDDMIGTFAVVNLISYILVPRFNAKVEYLPQSWIGQREKEKQEKFLFTHNLTHYEKRLDPIPIAYASKKSIVLGFSLKF